MGVSGKPIRLSKAAREFNVGISTIVEYLAKKGVDISSSPNTKLEPDMYAMLENEFASQKSVKEEALKIGIEYKDHRTITIEDQVSAEGTEDTDDFEEEVFITDTTIGTEAEEEPAKEEAAKEEVTADVVEPVEEEEETPEPEVVEEIIEPVAVEEDKPEEATEKEVTEKVEEEKTIEEPVKEEKTEAPVPEEKEEKSESEETDKPSLKVIEKIDLDKINQKTKPARKSKAEKKKEQEQKKQEEQKQKEAVAIEKKKTAKEEKAKQAKAKEAEEKLEAEKKATEAAAAKAEEAKKEPEKSNFIKTKVQKLEGPKIVDKIDLPVEKKKPVASSKDPVAADKRKKRRKRIKPSSTSQVKPEQKQQQQQQKQGRQGDDRGQRGKTRKGKKERTRPEISDEDVQKQIKETLAKLTGGGKSKAVKHRRDKRQTASQQRQKELEQQELDKNILKVTEFVTANELASMMDVQVTEVISTCMSLGMFVSINQRLDAETLSLVAEEFSFEVEFVSVDVAEAIHETGIDDEDKEEDLEPLHYYLYLGIKKEFPAYTGNSLQNVSFILIWMEM